MEKTLRIVVILVALVFSGALFWRAAEQPGPVRTVIEKTSAVAEEPLLLPEIVSVAPEKDARNVLLDIEDPIVVTFRSSMSRYYIRFNLEPSVEMAYENNADKTEFRLIPKSSLRDGTQYRLTLSYRLKDEPQTKENWLYETAFSTAPPQPTEWSADFPTRLSEALTLTRPKIRTGKYIDINLKSQVMTLFEDGKALDSYMISSGKPGMETPPGTYQIWNKAPRVWSKAYGLFMPYWMALVQSGKFGIHELPEWPGGYKEGAAHLGRPVSHGCVRLGVGPAKRTYEWADMGTPVIAYR